MPRQKKPLPPKNDKALTFYVRGPWDGEVRETWGEGVLTGPVTVKEIHAWAKKHPESFFAGLA